MKSSFKDLTKFEKRLWFASVVIIVAAFMLSKSDDFLTIIASLIGVTALIFVAKGYVIGQVLTVIFAVFYGIISFFFQYYGEMITYLGMTAPIAVMAVISWMKNPYEDSKEVAVNDLKKSHIIGISVASAVTTIAFYFILGALGNANLLVSTISVTTSFFAASLTYFRSPFYAVAYALNDIVLIVLWTLASLESLSYLPMVVCFVMFFINDVYGFYNWQKMKQRQQQ